MIAPRRAAELRIRGRRTGRVISFPVAIADYEGGRYLQVAPGARPHIPVDRTAPLADFERISPDYPVFRIGADAA